MNNGSNNQIFISIILIICPRLVFIGSNILSSLRLITAHLTTAIRQLIEFLFQEFFEICLPYVTFPLQLYDKHMYLRFCTDQTIHSGQNLLNYAVETIQFEVNMIKESRQFLHSHCGHR